MIDLHSHILPGIDDGSPDIDTSIRMCEWLVSQGVTDVVATPHYVNETDYTSPANRNSTSVAKITEILTKNGVKLNVYLGNEIYICREIEELVKAGKIASINGSKYLLIELPMSGEYPNYLDILLELMQHGYKVILAHPERYESFKKDFSLIEELHEAGVLFQCNLGSLVDRYGKKARKTLVKMLKNKMVFGFGSDLHRPGSTDYLIEAQKKLAKHCEPSELDDLLVRNPASILF